MIASHAAPSREGEKRRRWKGFLISAVLIVGAAALVGVVAMLPKVELPPASVELVPVNVEVLRIQPLPELADTFDLTAVIEPERIVKVAAEVAGRIERPGERSMDVAWRGSVLPRGAPIAEGEPVVAGEPIYHLNKDQLRARVDRAAAQYDFDEREYRRLLDLFERGTTSRSELDDARTRRDISKADLEQAALQLERTTIVAPIGGILNRLPMELGEYAVPGSVVAEIVDLRTVKVVADVPERDVQYLALGQPAEVHLHATATVMGAQNAPADDSTCPGTITYIDAVASPGTRTTRVEISVDNHDYRLRAGQIVRVRLTRRVLRDVVMIPLAAVIPLEDGKEVYVVEGGRAARRPVELGFLKGHEVQIVRGLAAGDELIVTGHRYVGPGQPVNVVARRAAGEGLP